MKTASPELIAFLQSNTEFLMADLYTITLASGEVLRYTNADLPITTVNDSLNPNLFASSNDFLNSASNWKTGPTLSNFFNGSASPVADPLGGLSATKFIASSTAQQGLFLRYLTPNYTPPAIGLVNPSIYVYVPSQAGVNSFGIVFDDDNLTTNSAAGSSTKFNEWVRFSAPITLSSNSAFFDFNIYINGYSAAPSAGFVLHAWRASLTVPRIFSATGPLIKRGAVRTVIGLEVDTLDLKIAADMNDTANTIDGYPFIEGILKGGLDGASVLLERAFMSSWKAAPVGTVVLFSGRVSSVSGGRSEARITVKSDIELLNIKLPRNLYQASCMHTLYDTGCAVNKVSFTQSGQVTQVNDKGLWVQTNLSSASSYFDQGVLTFTSGPNAGLRRTVKAYATGQFWFALPLPKAPTVGDTFTVYPGCDKTKTTCTSKFNNVLRFRGFPFIPTPEVAT